MRALVTVVIPTKNRWQLLMTTLSSVLVQRDVPLEIVVVEDGGSDETAAQLERAGSKRLRAVRHETSRGVSAARNTGLEQAGTPWVAFVDDDDVWSPDKLRRQLAALAAAPHCRWACSAAVTFTRDGRLSGIQPPPATSDVAAPLLRKNVVPGGGSGVLVETSLLQEVGGFEPSLSNLADWECWLRLGQASPVARVSTPDVGYRQHKTSMAHNVRLSELEVQAIRARYSTLYREHGVDLDSAPWLWYLEQLTYTSGRWREGVRRSWDLSRMHGHGRALLHPAWYLVPGHVRRSRADRVLAARRPADYAAAQKWLMPLLQQEKLGAPDRKPWLRQADWTRAVVRPDGRRLPLDPGLPDQEYSGR